jgi:SlyX protein
VNMDNSAEHRLDALESRLTFQEDHIQQLNDIITKLQLEVMRLSERVSHSEQRLQEVTPSLLRPLSEESPPPHY